MADKTKVNGKVFFGIAYYPVSEIQSILIDDYLELPNESEEVRAYIFKLIQRLNQLK